MSNTIGAVPALKGFRVQFLYTLHRLLHGSEEHILRPEGKEDIDVLNSNSQYQELIQVKDYAANLTLSDLEPYKERGFFRRSLESLNANPDTKIQLISFGKLGEELRRAFLDKNSTNRDKIREKLKSHFDSDEVDTIYQKVELVEVKEQKIKQEVLDWLSTSEHVKADVAVAYNLLIYWIYNISEQQLTITKNQLLEQLNKIGVFLSERTGYHSEFRTTILPFDQIELTEERRRLLRQGFYEGISARYEHVEANLDVTRSEKLEELSVKNRNSNIVIVHGSSGQGKSTLAYRFLKDFVPSELSYEIKLTKGVSNVHSIANTVRGILKSVNIAITCYIDVQPGNNDWIEFAKEFYTEPNIRVLVTIREEDWNKSLAVGSDFQFEDLELNFTRDDAQEIYAKLSEYQLDRRFTDFEEAWIRFGQRGNLLEFVHLITQGERLKDRLKAQVARVCAEAVKNEEYSKLLFLRLVMLADTYGARINLRKLVDTKWITELQNIIKFLEREFFIKVESGVSVTGLHPLRSMLIADLEDVFDELEHRKEEYQLKCLDVIQSEDYEGFLLNCFYENSDSSALVSYLAKRQNSNWTECLGIINSLLWIDIKRYVDENRNVFDEAFAKYGLSMETMFSFDLQGSSLSILDVFDKFVDDKQKEDADNFRSQLTSIDSVLGLTKNWLDYSAVPTIKTMGSDPELAAIGKSLFWLNYLDVSKTIELNSYNFNTFFAESDINSLAYLLLGISCFDESSKAIAEDNHSAFLDRIKRQYLVPKIEISSDRVLGHVIFDIKEDYGKEEYKKASNQPHKKAIRIIRLLRLGFPNLKKYGVKSYGQQLDSLTEETQWLEVEKSIPAEHLPLDITVQLNVIYKNLVLYKYRVENWQNYADNIIAYREKSINAFDSLLSAFHTYFKEKRAFEAFAKRLSNLKEEDFQLTKSSYLPRSVADEFGRFSEWNINRDRIQLTKTLLSIEKYNDFRKAFQDYSAGVSNFMNQCFGTMLEHAGLQENEGSNKTRTSTCNVYDAQKNLDLFQRTFRKHFEKFVDDGRLNSIEKFEREGLAKLSFAWCHTLWTNRNFEGNILKIAGIERKLFRQKFEKGIEKGLEKLSDETFDFEVIWQSSDLQKNIVIADIEDAINYWVAVEKVITVLQEAVGGYEFPDYEYLILEQEYGSFELIVMVQGKTLNSISLNIPLQSLSKSIEQFEFADLNPKIIEPILVEALELQSWSTYYSKIKEYEQIVSRHANLVILVNHLLLLKPIGELDLDKEELPTFEKYANQKFYQIGDLMQEILNLYMAICDDDYYKKEEIETDELTFFFFQSMLSLKESVYPTADEHTTTNHTVNLNFNILEEWYEKLRENSQAASNIFLLVSRKIINNYGYIR